MKLVSGRSFSFRSAGNSTMTNRLINGRNPCVGIAVRSFALAPAPTGRWFRRSSVGTLSAPRLSFSISSPTWSTISVLTGRIGNFISSVQHLCIYTSNGLSAASLFASLSPQFRGDLLKVTEDRTPSFLTQGRHHFLLGGAPRRQHLHQRPSPL